MQLCSMVTTHTLFSQMFLHIGPLISQLSNETRQHACCHFTLIFCARGVLPRSSQPVYEEISVALLPFRDLSYGTKFVVQAVTPPLSTLLKELRLLWSTFWFRVFMCLLHVCINIFSSFSLVSIVSIVFIFTYIYELIRLLSVYIGLSTNNCHSVYVSNNI